MEKPLGAPLLESVSSEEAPHAHLVPPTPEPCNTTICMLSPSEPLPSALSRKLLCQLLPFIMLGYGLSFVDRSNLAYAKLDESIAHDVSGLDEAAYGLAAVISSPYQLA